MQLERAAIARGSERWRAAESRTALSAIVAELQNADKIEQQFPRPREEGAIRNFVDWRQEVARGGELTSGQELTK